MRRTPKANAPGTAGRLLLLAAMALIMGNGGRAAGDDWAQFRGPRRDGKSGESGLLKQWPEGGPEMLWVNEEIGFGFASPAVADGMIYTTGLESKMGCLYALSLDGELVWKTIYGRGWTGPHKGTRTTPTVHDGRLYVMSGHGKAACYDAAIGREVWSVDTREKFGARKISWGITECPLVLDDKVIFTPGGERAGVVALDPGTGETVWVCEGIDDKSGYCSLVTIERGGRTVIVQLMATTVVGIEAATGRLLWRAKRDPEPPYGIQAILPVYEDGMFYVTTGDGGRRGQMFRVGEDGNSISRGWSDSQLDTLHGGLILHEGHIYGSSHENNPGKWLCLDLRTGEVEAMIDGVGRGSVIFADGLLYTYGHKGRMGLVKPDPEDFRLISSFTIERGEGPHWPHPAISDGRLYLRHGTVLYAFDIRAGRDGP